MAQEPRLVVEVKKWMLLYGYVGWPTSQREMLRKLLAGLDEQNLCVVFEGQEVPNCAVYWRSNRMGLAHLKRSDLKIGDKLELFRDKVWEDRIVIRKVRLEPQSFKTSADVPPTP